MNFWIISFPPPPPCDVIKPLYTQQTSHLKKKNFLDNFQHRRIYSPSPWICWVGIQVSTGNSHAFMSSTPVSSRVHIWPSNKQWRLLFNGAWNCTLELRFLSLQLTNIKKMHYTLYTHVWVGNIYLLCRCACISWIFQSPTLFLVSNAFVKTTKVTYYSLFCS